jgi:adenosylcobinamide-GDP ribazoletransferase
MNDRHLGSFGALALVLTLLAKLSLLAVLAAQSPVAVLVALLCAHVVSRFWPLLLAQKLACLDSSSERLEPRALAIAGGWSLAALALAVATQGAAFAILGTGLGGLALLAARRLFAQRLQGFTKACTGAAQQACEIAFYLGAAIGAGVR